MVYLETGPDLGLEATDEFGLEPPLQQVSLYLQDETRFEVLIGVHSTDQMHDYVSIEGSTRLSRTRISLTVEQLLEGLRPEQAP
jgi:hypothetical protein